MRLRILKVIKAKGTRKRASQSLLMATTALAVSVSATQVFAQEPSGSSARAANGAGHAAARPFNIPAQQLSSAIGAFGRQSGLQVTLATPATGSTRTNAVIGSFTAHEALARLLAGTGINFRITGGGRSVVIGVGQAAVDVSSSADTTVLETITVAGKSGRSAAAGAGYQGTPDWVYETPASVSVVGREAIQSAGVRNTRDVFNRVSGVYAGEGNGSFPTVSPNVRGLQESGRVVVSIDGARQNAQRGAGFGGAANYTANSGQGYVDTAFIRAVEVEKMTSASSGSAGSLGGKVDFRTVGADDLIAEGATKGGDANMSRGSNGYDLQGSVLGAMRLPDGPLALTLGYSRTIMDEYKVGTKGEDRNTSANMKNLMGRDGWSTFVKGEGDFGDVETSLSWMHQQNNFVYGTSGGANINREGARNDSITFKVDWDPESALIDLKSSLWLNDNMTHELREARPGLSGAAETNIDLGTKSFGGTIENTSRFDTAFGALSLNYGVEAFRDVTTAVATSTTITANPDWASNYTSFSPPGRRDVASLFLGGQLEPAEWMMLRGGVRYDWSRLRGTSTYYRNVPASRYLAGRVTNNYDYLVSIGQGGTVPAVLIPIFRSQLGEVYNGLFYRAGTEIPALSTDSYDDPIPVDINRTDSAWLPSATIEFKPTDWFRPYLSYSQSFRPPTILEAFFAGGPPGDGGAGTTYAPNEYLRPEKATTYEIGANMSFDGVLSDYDSVRLKVAAFKREVKDYIALGYIVTDEVLNRTYNSFVNLDGTTHMRGLELEGNYDARSFWLGGSATFLKTEWPSKTQVFSNGTITTSGEVFGWPGDVAPKMKLTLDTGVRLFDEKVSLGARANRVMATQSRTLDSEGNLINLTGDYTTVDLYGSYSFTENATLRFAVNNLTDKNYIPAASGYSAPGRTFVATMTVKF
ncbi:TonB-dependent hemoglobin/transferrin/lactoferrin family receptor [Agrobacterium tumefaciens]|uniref:TonB-dependent receptor n=1 Tax=Agrobacterium tumefaciens TaxID=358 RepID=UPI00287BE781|nr:TonB-dependent hemoglobin/transferrin/lactoferrin family receptor [Agrobacterium tumefaciens]MDS7594730.1 TonB-dependent hemoglobin/transferrin/lactoferrin family receptor [Agrobacterium tumefaciens]